MKLTVFVSESKVSRKKYTEDMKPRERLEYLSKYKSSSFKKITDAKGKIVDASAKKPAKPKLSGKPKAPKQKQSAAPTRKRRNPVSLKLKKQVLGDIKSPRARKSVEAAIEKINNGTANKRNLATIQKHADEDTSAAFEKAFGTSRKRAKEGVESRRQDISETPKKKVAKKAKPEPEAPKKKKAVKKAVKQAETPPEKPQTKDAATAIQQLPKQQRGSMLESLKRVFSKTAKPADIEKIDKASRKTKDPKSRETLKKLKRYAEHGVGKPPEKETKKTRKRLTKMQMYDRIRDTDMPKVEQHREKAKALETEFREKAKEIREGKGTKDERIKKITKIRDTYQARINKQIESASKKSKQIRDSIAKIREESDRADGERTKKK